MTIPHHRKDFYARFSLHEEDADPDPTRQFERWFDEAAKNAVPDYNAMTLATCTGDGRPSARIVLLRGIDGKREFACFSPTMRAASRVELDKNPVGGTRLLLARSQERQVRVEGPESSGVNATRSRMCTFTAVPRARASGRGPRRRARSSRAGKRSRNDSATWKVTLQTERSLGHPTGLEDHRLVPDTLEFWQGRPNRLHDRLRYSRRQQGDWLIERLAP